MSTTINASTSGGLIQTADTSGVLELQSNGATQLTIVDTGVYGSLKSSVAQTASGTAVNFVDIPSWVKRITVMFNGVSTNGTSAYLVQIGDSGGIENTGYNSGSARISTTAVIGQSATTGFIISVNTAASIVTGHLSLTNITANDWCSSHSMGQDDSIVARVGGGSKTLSATLDRIRITTVNGTDTFDAGTINIMYEG